MKNRPNQVLYLSLSAVFVLAVCAHPSHCCAKSGDAGESCRFKEAAAINRQALAQFTWVEQVTISLKGEQKKQEHFQVRLGPDGKPQKTSLDPPPSDSSGHEGRLKKRIVDKKKEEYKEYADNIKALIQRYVPPDKDLIEQARQKGNIMLGPAAGAPGEYRLV